MKESMFEECIFLTRIMKSSVLSGTEDVKISSVLLFLIRKMTKKKQATICRDLGNVIMVKHLQHNAWIAF